MNRVVIVLGVAAIAALAGFLLGRQSPDHTMPATTQGGRKVLYWHDPMVPGSRFDRPGKSPFMDMELVPVYEGDAGGAGAVRVAPGVQQTLALRVHTVKRELLAARLEAGGFVFDPDPLAAGGTTARLRVLGEVYAPDAGWLRPGIAASVKVSGIERPLRGTVERIEPDPGQRALRLRVRLLDHDSQLRANRSAIVAITGPGKATLAVPREALIRTATRTTVIRVQADDSFMPVDVTSGGEYGELVEIRSGLRAGDRIVTAGQFLLDAESNLRAGLGRLSPAPGDAVAPAAPGGSQ